MTTLGKLTCGQIEVVEDSISMDQISDLDASAPTHNHVILYKENGVDPTYTDGWYTTEFNVEDLSNVNADSEPAHNEVLSWNDNTTDPSYATGWVNKDINSVLSDLPDTISSIANVQTAMVEGEEGNAGKTDMIMMSSDIAGGGTFNLSLASGEDFNAIYKKEITDASFSFVQSLSKGEIANLTYTTGTVIRSSKGVCGLTGPFPTPLGVSSMAIQQARFSTLIAGTTVLVASMGTEVEVTLYAADGTTVVEGPVVVDAYNTATLTCDTTAEFYLKSSGYIVAAINANGSEIRILPPMATEIITWNRKCVLNSYSGTATVTYYRRNGNTGQVSVVEGTPYDFSDDGSNQNFATNGCMIFKSDKPIWTRTGEDSSGDQSIAGWPMSQLAQCFPNPSYLDSTANYGTSAIIIGSPYEGTATVYDSTGTLLDSFDYTRSNAVTTADDQVYPAAGRWRPEDVSASTVLEGGYVCTNTPAICIYNFNGSSIWTSDGGKEMIVPGTTPIDIKAEIVLDANGIWRRRDIDASGVVTWNIC